MNRALQIVSSQPAESLLARNWSRAVAATLAWSLFPTLDNYFVARSAWQRVEGDWLRLLSRRSWMDHWEKFVTMPVRRVVPPTPVVPVDRVRGAIGPCAAVGPKVEIAPPELRRGKPYAQRRSSWPLLAELYAKHGSSKPLDWYCPRVGMTDHTSVRYALVKMGVYRGKGKPQGPPRPVQDGLCKLETSEAGRSQGRAGLRPECDTPKTAP